MHFIQCIFSVVMAIAIFLISPVMADDSTQFTTFDGEVMTFEQLDTIGYDEK